jgi:VanZ family protein
MFETFTTVAAWTCLAFIVYATLAPIELRPALPNAINIGPIEHIGAFALFGVLFCAAYPQHTIIDFIFVIGTAGLLEFTQIFRADRHGRVSDALQKMAGGVVGVLVAIFLSSVCRSLDLSF